jgi:phosphatidylglycerol:prolipoprotein diacylglycerol transferase
MIPFFQFQTINVGPITIQVWGLFVALGIATAIGLAYFLCRRYLLSVDLLLDMAIWALVGGMVMARIFHVALYNPGFFAAHPEEILQVWHGGASSLGGFAGAALSVWIFSKKRKLTLKELLPYFDIGAVSLWLGWGIGRIGCFLIHDHPGTMTSFVLGVNFPDGARFDLGLLESLLGFVLFAVFYLLFRKLITIRWGLVASLSFIVYAIVRFFFDFLRIPAAVPGGDLRYASLTPAQWGMICIVIGLTTWLVWGRIRGVNMAKNIEIKN